MDSDTTVYRELRKRSGLLQSQVATLVGCRQSYISMVETKKKTPSPALAQRLLETLSIAVTAKETEHDT